jgi:hypothetical protein
LQVIIEVDLLEDVDGFGPLLGPDQLDVEVEGRAARNDVAGTLIAVTELCEIKFIKSSNTGFFPDSTKTESSIGNLCKN